ncbi:PP2C family protein-serine/threonine phosphatase [Balneolales bacterium ANBcel1]|nr:PP2C family protein-serine/threonine phosphatase [Balneolales bacterium ANBcel1]
MPDPNQKYSEHQSRFDLQTLLDTSRLLIESHDVDFVLNNLLLISMGKLMVQRAAIFWYHPRSSSYSVIKKKGRIQLPDTFSIPEKPFRTSNAIYCGTHPELALIAESGIRLMIPIKSSNRHLGYLALGPKPGNLENTREETDILESFVFMSGIAISNSELVGELKSTNRKLDYKVQELHTLFDLSKAFNVSTNRKEIIRLFKYTLLGQMFIRRFFLVVCRNHEPVLVTENGLQVTPDDTQLDKLFRIEKDIIRVDDSLRSEIPFLDSSEMVLILKLHGDAGEPAILGLGKRANGKDFEQTDYNFLISLGNLALMSVQKTFLLEDQIEKERMEEELQIARSIQQKLLPETIPEVPGLQIAGRNVPSYQVGGDYFDLIRHESGNLTMAIADVTGKGVPASLLMANLQSVLHILQPFEISLVDATGQINALIYQNTPSDKFISFFWGLYSPENRTLRYVNAGHNPPILLRENTEPRLLTEGGVLLGAMPTLTPYSEGTLPLEKGDLLVMYTDGVTEAMNADDEEYGEERLTALLDELRGADARDILEGITADVGSFCDDQFTDDLTLIVIKVH